jgi:protocatechuate 3,4-dioxygenase beta subunit
MHPSPVPRRRAVVFAAAAVCVALGLSGLAASTPAAPVSDSTAADSTPTTPRLRYTVTPAGTGAAAAPIETVWILLIGTDEPIDAQRWRQRFRLRGPDDAGPDDSAEELRIRQAVWDAQRGWHTGATGEFELERAGAYISFAVSAPGRRPAIGVNRKRAELLRDGLSVALPAGRMIDLQLRDDAGNPVPNGRAWWNQANALPTNGSVATSGLDGALRVTGLPTIAETPKRRAVGLTITAFGYQPGRVLLTHKEYDKPIAVTLRRVGYAFGRLTRLPNGEGFDPASLEAAKWRADPEGSIDNFTVDEEAYSGNNELRGILEYFWADARGQALAPDGRLDPRYGRPGAGMMSTNEAKWAREHVYDDFTSRYAPDSTSRQTFGHSLDRPPTPEAQLWVRCLGLGDGRYTLHFLHPAFEPVRSPVTIADALPRRVDLAPKPGIRIRGVVRDPAGEPMAGVLVAPDAKGVWPTGGRNDSRPIATTDEAGRFEVGAVAPGTAVELWAFRRGFAPIATPVAVPDERPADGVVNQDVQLATGVVIRGSIEDRDGDPVAVTDVELEWQRGRTSFAPYHYQPVVTLGPAAYQFSIRGAFAGELTFTVTADGYIAHEATVPILAKRNTAVDGLDTRVSLTMRAEAVIAGRLLQPDGTPVQAGTLWLRRGESVGRPMPQYGRIADIELMINPPRVRSRAPGLTFDYNPGSGDYRIGGLEPGPAQLVLAADDCVPTIGEPLMTAPGETTAATLTAQAARRLRVRVVDPARRPIAGAQVGSGYPRRGTTDAEGTILFPTVTDSVVQIMAGAEGYVPVQSGDVPVAPTGTTDALIVLEPVAKLRGTLGGYPDGFDDGSKGITVIALPHDGRFAYRSGYYTGDMVPKAGPFSRDDVPSGALMVLVGSPFGAMAAEKTVYVPRGREFTVAFPDLGAAEPALADAHRKFVLQPAPGAAAFDPDGLLPALARLGGMRDLGARRGPDGRITGEVPPGRYVVTWAAGQVGGREPRTVIVPPAATRGELEEPVVVTVGSPPDARLTGSLAGSSGPLKSERIEIYRLPTDETPLEALAEMWQVPAAAVVRTDESGGFEIGPLRAGRYQVVAGRQGAGLGVIATVDLAAGQTRTIAPMIPAEPGKIELDLDGFPVNGGVTLFGRLIDAAGRVLPLPSQHGVVDIRSRDLREELAAVAPGRYTLVLRPLMTGIAVVRDIEVRAGETTTVKVVAAPAVPLALRVVTADGSPVSGASWQLADADGLVLGAHARAFTNWSRLPGAVVTDPTGRLLIPDLRAGRYRLTIQTADGTVHRSDVTLPVAGGGEHVVRLR